MSSQSNVGAQPQAAKMMMHPIAAVATQPVTEQTVDVESADNNAQRIRGGGAGKDCFIGLVGCFLCFECCEGCCDCIGDIICCPCELFC